MHYSEKRLVPRIAVNKLPLNTLTAICDGVAHRLISLKDISESGLRCEIDHNLPVSARVSIQYDDAKVRVAVHGRVAWCRKTLDTEKSESSHGTYMMGVELMSPMILFAVLPQGRQG